MLLLLLLQHMFASLGTANTALLSSQALNAGRSLRPRVHKGSFVHKPAQSCMLAELHPCKPPSSHPLPNTLFPISEDTVQAPQSRLSSSLGTLFTYGMPAERNYLHICCSSKSSSSRNLTFSCAKAIASPNVHPAGNQPK